MTTDTDTDFDRLSAAKRRPLVRFDPTFNSGTIVQIVVICVGGLLAFGAVKEQLATQRTDIENVKSNAVAESLRVKDSITDLKGDVKEVQRSINELGQRLAEIKAVSK